MTEQRQLTSRSSSAAEPEGLRHRWLTVRGRRVHATVAGAAAPPVVVVHGMVVASRSVTPLLAALARRGFQVWAPDLPGFGLTDKPIRALDVDELACFLAGWLDAARIDDVCLVGVSFGCQVAAALAARRPTKVARLALVGPTIAPQQRRLALTVLTPLRRSPPPALITRHPGLARWSRAASQGAAARVIRGRPRSDPRTARLVGVTVVEWICAGLLRAAATVAHAIRDDLAARLPAITVPTLVLRGERDRFCPPDWTELVAGLIPDSRIRALAGAGHSAQFSAAPAVAAEVSRFVNEEAPPGTAPRNQPGRTTGSGGPGGSPPRRPGCPTLRNADG